MAAGVALIYPTHGHIAPALGVVAELVAHGDAITFYATGRSRTLVERAGAGYRAYGVDHDQFNPTPPTSGLFADMTRLLALSRDLLPRLVDDVRALAPDYLLLDSKSVWGRLVAQATGIPAVTMSVVFAIRDGLVPASQVVDLLYAGASEERLLGGLLDMSGYFAIARDIDRRFGTRCPDLIEFLGNPQPLNIVFTSREFQISGDAFGPEYVFVGTSLLPNREIARFPWHTIGGGPLIYVSLGTTFNSAPDFYRACFDAFRGRPWQAIVSTGGGIDPASLGVPPANVHVHRFVPQLDVLARSAVFVTHGGMNSTNESLGCGVPMAVVPQRGDQFLVARRVEEVGAGLRLHGTPPEADAIRTGVERLLGDPSFTAAAGRVGESIRSAGGAARAAAAIVAATRSAR